MGENLSLVAGIAMTLGNRLLLRAGLRRRVDGWRRAAGLVLRGEAATFVLSAFALNVWSDVENPSISSVEAIQEHLAQRLHQFLVGEPSCHICVKRGKLQDHVEACAGPSYTLGFQSWVEGPGRFVRPESWAGKDCSTQRSDSTDVLLNIVSRIDHHGRADVWVRVNHIGIDGVPAQEIISRLETAWGISADVTYPSPQTFAAHVGPRQCRGRADLVEMQAFIDFGPLLEWRKTENARLAEPMTISAALLWCLARHEAFSHIYIGTTVEVPAIDGMGRGVGIVVVRPDDYFGGDDGLLRYLREFNCQLELTRRRASDGCKMLDAVALVGPAMATTVLRYALDRPRAFGSMGLTVIRDAKVFGAPMGDAGHPYGFIAVGSVGLQADNGQKVGCITVKGPAARVSNYPALIQEAIERC